MAHRTLIAACAVLGVFASSMARAQDTTASQEARFDRCNALLREGNVDDAVAGWYELLEESRDARGSDTADQMFCRTAMKIAQNAPFHNDERIELLEEALGVIETGSMSRADLYFGGIGYELGAAYQRSGRTADTIAIVEEAIVRASEVPHTQPFLLDLLVMSEITAGRYEKALLHLGELESIEDVRTNRYYAALRLHALELRARGYWLLGIPEVARRAALEQEKVLEETFDTLRPEDRALAKSSVDVNSVWRLMSSKDWRGAIARAERALEEPGELDPSSRDRLHLQRAMARLFDGEEGALELVEKALDGAALWETIRTDAFFELARWHVEQGDLARARELLAELDEQFGEWPTDDVAVPRWATAWLSTLRSRIARREGAPRERIVELRAELEHSLDEMLASWSELPDLPGGIGFLRPAHRRSLICEWLDTTLLLEADARDAAIEEAFGLMLELQQASSHLRPLGRRFSLAELRAQLLDERHGVLLHILADESGYVLAMDETRVFCAKVAGIDAIEGARREWMNALRRIQLPVPTPRTGREADVETFARLSGELGAALLPPDLQDFIHEWSSLTVIAPDWGPPIAYEWLHLANGRAVALEKAVAYLSSLPMGGLLAEAADGRTELGLDLALVGGDTKAARERELFTIPLAADEGRLRDGYDAERVLVLLDDAARLDGLASHDLSEVGVLQFLAHGVETRSAQGPLGIALDEIYGVPEIEVGGAPRHVVLTVCRSADTLDRRGDAPLSLGRSFLRAGSLSTLSARGPITYGAAMTLSVRYHAALRRGLSPAEALREVRRELERETPGSAAAFTGLFLAEGLAHRPVFPVPDDPRWGMWLGVGAIGAVLGLLVRRRFTRASEAA